MQMNIWAKTITIVSIFFLISGWLNFSAQSEQNFNPKANSKEWIRNWIGEKLPLTARTAKPYRTISANWNMKKILSMVGLPDKIGGFGISILTYNLNDKTLINIGVTDFEKPPIYVIHVFEDGTKQQLLKMNP